MATAGTLIVQAAPSPWKPTANVWSSVGEFKKII